MINFENQEEILTELHHLQKKYSSILDYIVSITKQIHGLKEEYKDLYKCCQENESQIAKLNKNVGHSDLYE